MRDLRLDLLGIQAGVAQDHVGNLRIGAPGEIVSPQIAAIAEGLLDGDGEREARCAAVGDQGSVDVEEDEPAHTLSAFRSPRAAVLHAGRGPRGAGPGARNRYTSCEWRF